MPRHVYLDLNRWGSPHAPAQNTCTYTSTPNARWDEVSDKLWQFSPPQPTATATTPHSIAQQGTPRASQPAQAQPLAPTLTSGIVTSNKADALRDCGREESILNRDIEQRRKTMAGTPRRDLARTMVRTYGNVVLDDDIYEFLGHGPGFAMLDQLNRIQLERIC